MVPVRLADELLEALPVPVVQIGDRLDVLRPEVRQEAPDVAGGVAASGAGPEGLGERSDELVQAGGPATQQARVDLGIVEQLTQPDAEPTFHRATPSAGDIRRGDL